MTPYYADDWLTVYHGDSRAVLAELEPESVHCVVTSPPYWGLRDYGTATWIGGDEACDHKAPQSWIDHNFNANSTIGNGSTQSAAALGRWYNADGSCRCGATRVDSQLGLEPTPEAYVANLIAVFREVRRVLRADGTVWLNLGDSYSGGNSGQTLGSHSGDIRKRIDSQQTASTRGRPPVPGMKPKDLVGIPWMVAFALRADGWYLRSDIIWSKPNPMPESVTDRPTKSHEYLFLLSKSARYYFDADAVREAALPSSIARYAYADEGTTRINKGGAYREKWNDGDKHIGVPTVPDNPAGRNIRSVWTIATQPYGMVTPESAYADGPLDTLSPDCPVHSLRAIRQTRQTAGDDGLLDHLRPRSRGNGGRPGSVPVDGLFASLDLDSSRSTPTTPGSVLVGSSREPTPGSARGSRTPALPTSDDGPESDGGLDARTNRRPDPTSGRPDVSSSDEVAATRRSEPESRTTGASDAPGSSGHSTADHTSGTAAVSAVPEARCSCPQYSASHFATFPPKLVEPCIKAGTSERGVCPECGAPWERIVEASPLQADRERNVGGREDGFTRMPGGEAEWRTRRDPITFAWLPSCDCRNVAGPYADNGPHAPVPATVLDPFAGSGTTGMVAQSLSRRAVLIDLSMDYLGQLMERNRDIPLGLGA